MNYDHEPDSLGFTRRCATEEEQARYYNTPNTERILAGLEMIFGIKLRPLVTGKRGRYMRRFKYAPITGQEEPT